MITFFAIVPLSVSAQPIKVVDFGDDGWIIGDTRENGIVEFVAGPDTPPLGSGSLRLATTSNNPDKAGVIKVGDFGDLSGVSGHYQWYRTSSTNGFQAPAFKLGIDTTDTNPSGLPYDKILVYEPYFQSGFDPATSDFVWKLESFDQNNGKWWLWDSTHGTDYGQSYAGVKTLSEWQSDSTFGVLLSNGNIVALLFEVGSWNANTDGYVDDFYLSLLGYTTDFDVPPPPTEVWVDDDYYDGGTNDGHTWGYDAFNTIQGGIDAVSGSIVHVAAGTYNENVVVNKEVILLGAQANVDARGRGGVPESVITASSGKVIYVNHADVTIDGFNIRGHSASPSHLIFCDDAHNLFFKNNIVNGSANNGLWFGTTSKNVTIYHNGFNGSAISSYILYFDGGDIFDNLTISCNEFSHGDVFAGDKNFNSKNMLIEGNLFNDSTPNLSSQFHDSSIENNVFCNNLYTNMQVGLKNSKILDNTFMCAGPSPDTGYPSYALMLWGNQYGLTPSQNVEIRGNTFYYNCISAPDEISHGLRILEGIDATTIEIHCNQFIDSKAQTGGLAVVNQGAGIVNAENNWWGDPSGPYYPTLNPSGKGGQVGDNIDFDPWATSTPPCVPPSPPAPVGGVIVPVDKIGLLSTYITTAFLIIVISMIAVVLNIRYNGRRRKKQ